MVVFNYSGAEINAKIVYYGPGLSGKTTNLEFIYTRMPAHVRGKMVSMKTRTDRTLFFDFLPVELGEISGFRTRFLLYTVPGQVYYNATRKLVLKGADAIVFVADSSPSKLQENVDSLRNLEENLNEHGLSLDTIPWIIQYNKRDVKGALPVSKLESKLNPLKVPSFEAVATKGTGIYDTFQAIAGILYDQLKIRLQKTAKGAPDKTTGAAKPGGGGIRPHRAEAHDDNEAVSEVVEVALREMDGDAPAIPEVRKSTSGRKPPSAKAQSKQRSEGEEFRFASLEDAEIDNNVGRVVHFDEEPAIDDGDDGDDDFITDPCRPNKTVSKKDKTAEAPPRREDAVAESRKPQPADDCAITIPVVISPAQVKKTIPIKLTLEIQVVDEDA